MANPHQGRGVVLIEFIIGHCSNEVVKFQSFMIQIRSRKGFVLIEKLVFISQVLNMKIPTEELLPKLLGESNLAFVFMTFHLWGEKTLRG